MNAGVPVPDGPSTFRTCSDSPSEVAPVIQTMVASSPVSGHDFRHLPRASVRQNEARGDGQGDARCRRNRLNPE